MEFFNVLLNSKYRKPSMYFPKARWNHYSRILEHAENHFQRAFNVTQQMYILVLYCAKMFFVNFKMAAVFLAKA
jgi:hypothetical protein